MTSIESCLRRVRDDLDDLGRSWALVGALAVAAYTEARATLDIDVVVAIDSPGDVAILVASLVDRGYAWKASFGQSMVSLEVPNGPDAELRLDILFSLTGVEPEVARSADRISVLRDLELPVALRGDLIALKLLAAREPEREHDRRDLRALVASATERDFRRARATIALLVARNMVPDGELEDDLDALRNR